MKTLLVVLLVLALVPLDSLAKGFSGGRSSFSGGRSSSFSSGRSSFSAPRTYSAPRPSVPSASRSSRFGTSSRGSFGMGSTTTRGSSFGTSSRGKYGTGSSSIPSLPRSNREVLISSTSVIHTPYRSVPIYYYYYPTPWYGSGYGFYQWYYWSHFWGNHSHCYHRGGGMAPAPRKCDPSPKTVNMVNGSPTNICSEGELCDLKTHECRLKE